MNFKFYETLGLTEVPFHREEKDKILKKHKNYLKAGFKLVKQELNDNGDRMIRKYHK